MTYEQTLDFLFTKLPMYQRIGKQAFKKDLTNITKLCNALGNPHDKFKSIHIAGTNGKGSTSHILSAIYQQNGYKVGMYTSPHLVDFRERIKVNGQLCSQEFVISFVDSISNLIETIEPSFFEITVAMAFHYFAEEQVDVAIIETGLGGRLDSTNIITPLCSVITSIGFDHMDMLGNTLEAIAGEKAGIIKPNIPVVVGDLPDEALHVVQERAKTQNASLTKASLTNHETDLLGAYQQANIAIAVHVTSVLDQQLPTKTEEIKTALLNVSKLSNFEGRWQVINNTPPSPTVICDVGHNEEGFRLIADQLKSLNKKIHYVLGFVSDKKLDQLIPLLPQAISYHFVRPEVIRGMDVETVHKHFLEHGIKGTTHEKLYLALKTVVDHVIAQNDSEDSVVFVGGSNFVVADLLHLKAKQELPF